MPGFPGPRECAVALTAMLFLPFAHAAATEYHLDSAHTVVSFEVHNLGLFSQRGTFDGASGAIALDAVTGSARVEILVDARSLKAQSPALQDFLRGESLLNVDQYPEIVYKSQHVVFVHGEPRSIEGELTLLGVTRPVRLELTQNDCLQGSKLLAHEPCALTATARFRRSEFGMTRYLAFASDEVTLVVNAVGVPGTGDGAGRAALMPSSAQPRRIRPRRR